MRTRDLPLPVVCTLHSSANSGGFCAVVLLSKLLLLIVSGKEENLFAIQAAGSEIGQLKIKVHHQMHWYQKWGGHVMFIADVLGYFLN